MKFKDIKNVICSSCQLIIDNKLYSFIKGINDCNEFDDYEIIGVRSKLLDFEDSYILISLKK